MLLELFKYYFMILCSINICLWVHYVLILIVWLKGEKHSYQIWSEQYRFCWYSCYSLNPNSKNLILVSYYLLVSFFLFYPLILISQKRGFGNPEFGYEVSKAWSIIVSTINRTSLAKNFSHRKSNSDSSKQSS
jgi:hypothetical protein